LPDFSFSAICSGRALLVRGRFMAMPPPTPLDVLERPRSARYRERRRLWAAARELCRFFLRIDLVSVGFSLDATCSRSLWSACPETTTRYDQSFRAFLYIRRPPWPELV